MSIFNSWNYELEEVLKANSEIKLLNYVLEEDENHEIKLEINNNQFIIFTNLNNYCYIESNAYNTDKINQEILYSEFYKTLNSIITTLVNFNFDTVVKKKIKYSDPYNFYNKLDQKTKVYIDFKQLVIDSKKYIVSNNDNSLMKIPKKFLLNSNQIYQLILNEINKINSNYDYLHFIEPINNIIYELKLTLLLNNNIVVLLKIMLDPKLYPFFPPKFEIISPKVDITLSFAIMNLNITKLANWNSTMTLEWIISNLAQKLDPIINDYIKSNDEHNDLDYNLLILANLIKENDNKLNIDIDIMKFDSTNKNDDKYWKSGTGYGSGNEKGWDIKSYIEDQEYKQQQIVNVLKKINDIIDVNNIPNITKSILFTYILNLTNEINMLQIENDYNILNEIIKILSKLFCLNKLYDVNFCRRLTKNLKSIDEEILILFEHNEEMQNNELFQGIHNIYQTYNEEFNNQDLIETKTENELDNKVEYCNIMKQLQFSMQTELLKTHRFYEHLTKKPEPTALKRIISEISSFKTCLPINYDSTIWVRIPKNNMNLFTFIISGPKDTPYENGLFEFHAYFPHDYPVTVPKVLINTTGNGKVRFNPNLYHCGKVCLSLLGTWSGQESESWNPKTSTFLQILVSIQSLILVEQPYFNEPGYERELNTPIGQIKNKEYNNKLEIETIRWAINDMINNPPTGYEDVIKNHFKLKKTDIINRANEWLSKTEPKFKKDLEYEVNNLITLLNNI
jgi:ubiquitin-protein ligase